MNDKMHYITDEDFKILQKVKLNRNFIKQSLTQNTSEEVIELLNKIEITERYNVKVDGKNHTIGEPLLEIIIKLKQLITQPKTQEQLRDEIDFTKYRLSYGLIRNEAKTGNVGTWVMYTNIKSGKRYFGVGHSSVKAKEDAMRQILNFRRHEECDEDYRKYIEKEKYMKGNR